jgi:phosphoribosylglycinamide formyltransferase-1
MANRTLAILLSGRGSNFLAIHDAIVRGELRAEIACVISNVAGAPGLSIARAAGVPALVVSHKDHPDRESFDQALSARLEQHGVELVALAGFMRILSRGFAERWVGRLINIHPSLLPAFKGLHVERQALAAGVRVSGCTVHLVIPDLDAGPIIAQAAVPVLPDDTEETLSARIRRQEHRLYPTVVRWFGEGRVVATSRGVEVKGVPPAATLLFSAEP